MSYWGHGLNELYHRKAVANTKPSFCSLPQTSNSWCSLGWYSPDVLQSQASFHFLLLSLSVNVIWRRCWCILIVAVLVRSRLNLTLASKCNVDGQLCSRIGQPRFCPVLGFSFWWSKQKQIWHAEKCHITGAIWICLTLDILQYKYKMY